MQYINSYFFYTSIFSFLCFFYEAVGKQSESLNTDKFSKKMMSNTTRPTKKMYNYLPNQKRYPRKKQLSGTKSAPQKKSRVYYYHKAKPTTYNKTCNCFLPLKDSFVYLKKYTQIMYYCRPIKCSIPQEQREPNHIKNEELSTKQEPCIVVQQAQKEIQNYAIVKNLLRDILKKIEKLSTKNGLCHDDVQDYGHPREYHGPGRKWKHAAFIGKN
jgi:hypothetical protein